MVKRDAHPFPSEKGWGEVKKGIAKGKLYMKQKTRLKKKALTKKEIQVVKLLCAECNSRKIAAVLGVSKRAIDSRRLKILRKIKAKSVVGIVKYAIKNKLYSLR